MQPANYSQILCKSLETTFCKLFCNMTWLKFILKPDPIFDKVLVYCLIWHNMSELSFLKFAKNVCKILDNFVNTKVCELSFQNK